ncbi:MAG: hypothetical protein ACREKL_16380, partial [Chthoniobacterales bacterium]
MKRCSFYTFFLAIAVNATASYLTVNDINTFGGANGTASALNANGLVAGSSMNKLDYFHAYIFSTASGQTTDLGTLGGNESFAYGISNGFVVGKSLTVSGTTNAFVY